MSLRTDSTAAGASVDPSGRILPGPSDDTTTTLCLLGGPYLVRAGRRVAVPEGSKRVLVFVALHGGVVDRRQIAGTLWPDGGDERAAGNLRSALWRLRGCGIDILEADKCGLVLCPGTVVDIHLLRAWAARVLDGTSGPADWLVPEWSPEALSLLPGWYDDWVIFERERLRQQMLHALEAVCYRLSDAGRHAEAVEAAMKVVELDPLRESGQRALICAHLAEGNIVEARRTYDSGRQVLQAELGLAPSADLTRLVATPPVKTPEPPGTAQRGLCHACPLLAGEPVTGLAGTR
jgi:DNA-binding SARP family transcriptional activator